MISSLDNGALAAARLVTPLVALQVGASAALVGLMSSLFTALPMLFSVRFGRWVDRRGTLAPIVFASLLIALSPLPFLAAPVAWSLLPIAGLIGSGAVFAHVAASRAVAGASDRSERARNLGLLVVGYSAFQFACPLLASLAFDHVGRRAALVAVGAFATLALAFVALPALHDFRNEAAPAGDGAGGAGLLRHAQLRRWILVSATFSASQTVLPFVLSLHAVAIGLSASQAGLAFGAVAIGAVLSRLGAGWVSRAVAPQRALAAALLLAASVYAQLPLTDAFGTVVAVSFTLGLPLGLGVPLSLNLIYDAAPPARVNEAVGLCMSVTNLLQTILPFVAGLIASGFGVAAMTSVIASALAIMGALTLWARRDAPRI